MKLAALRRHMIDIRPLRHAPYRRLFVGTSMANLGAQFTAVAVPVQMYAITHSSAWVGSLGVAALVPLVVFGIWGGAIADAIDRRALLLVSSLVMWVPTLALLISTLAHRVSPGWLLVLIFLQTVGMAVGFPTRQAIIPRLVPAAELAPANTLGFTASSVAQALGPLLAGLLVAGDHFAWAYVVDAASFTLVLWATWRLPSLAHVTPATAGSDAGRAGWTQIRAGLGYVGRSPVLWLSFAIDIAAMVLAMPRALFPQVADEKFGPSSIGWLYAAIALGAVIAGVTSGWIGRVRRVGTALFVAVVLWGLAIAAAGLARSLWLAVLLLAVGGAADLVSATYRQTILQTYAPDAMQGRVQGVFTSVVAGGPRLGDVRAGLMAAAYGTTVAWVGGGIACAVVAVALGVAFPALSRYVPADPAPADPSPAAAPA